MIKWIGFVVVGILVIGVVYHQKKEETTRGAYKRITAKTAKEIMDSEKDYIILDVRTGQEYREGHVSRAINIPVDQIGAKAERRLKNKSQKILIYCRSGARSRAASKKLVSMGYTDIEDFGGLIQWPYDVVK